MRPEHSFEFETPALKKYSALFVNRLTKVGGVFFKCENFRNLLFVCGGENLMLNFVSASSNNTKYSIKLQKCDCITWMTKRDYYFALRHF